MSAMDKHKKLVSIHDLIAAVPHDGVGVTPDDARQIAYAILDRCEAVDPTEEESEWERVAAAQDREWLAEKEAEMEAEMEADHARLVNGRQAARMAAAGANDQRWRSEVMRMGLDLREPTPHLVQVMKAGKVHAEWWPTKGTTMHRQQRGPRCGDSAAFLRWLRTLGA
jgi:hypothetical protein